MIYELEPFLDKYSIKYNASRRGNQMIRCQNEDGHANGDAHPSASLHLDKGLWNCLSCGEGGSAVDLVMIVEGVETGEAFRIAEKHVDGGSREVSRGSGRNNVGLPGKPGYRNKPGGTVHAWNGFRT